MGSEFGRTVRKLREQHGVSQQVLADLAGISRRWLVEIEAGTEPKLPHAIRLAEELAALVPEVQATDLLASCSAHLARRADIMTKVKRRRFIKYLSAVSGVAVIDGERLESVLAGLGPPDDRAIDDLEAISRGLVDEYWTRGPITVFPMVQGHLDGLRSMLASAERTELRRRLLRVLSETATLSGWLAFRLQARRDAEDFWALATAWADEAGDGPLRAYALIARTNLLSATWRDGEGGNAVAAIALLDAAASVMGPHSSPLRRAWLYARRAEEHAIRGVRRACETDLERAARALAEAEGCVEDGFLRSWDQAQLAGYRGNCAQLLGRWQEAISILDETLPNIPPTMLNQRAAVLTNLAAAHSQEGQDGVEQACGLLRQALDIAGPARLVAAQQRIAGVRQRRLRPFTRMPAVQQLDEQLRSWTTPS
ncbi:MAG: helix-turn-helix transcriptional regulator [Candidatus Dormibacteraeota bacterium]|uniref:Helix-turn-helix transcriptional regulator n=1 Tax=Candidatus Nephthysia bennettiae TaxID=3127016 RepID=A0A934N1I9_9BACT|nr:helix-turn-helix transcriptional regulator [Candidatus Dormibacteraeota bacterium]MBJ7613480.1 helix-turn-helix transcriptional regulator [Candidatus Dormibacteraeota bacterium]